MVCRLDVGQDESVQIVTGATNVFEGAYVPVALSGSRIPGPLHGQPKKEGGVKIEAGKLRGVKSDGMLCSFGELGFTDKVVPVNQRDGIWILNEMCIRDRSTAFTVVFIAGGMLIVSGVKWRHMGILAGAATVAGVGLILMDTEGYRFARFTSFLDPFADALGNGWQVVQSLLAMGTGGLTGLSLIHI